MEISEYCKSLGIKESNRMLIRIEVDEKGVNNGIYEIDVIDSDLSLEEYCNDIFNSVVEEWDEEGEGYSLDREGSVKIYEGFGKGEVYLNGELYMEVYERGIEKE